MGLPYLRRTPSNSSLGVCSSVKRHENRALYNASDSNLHNSQNNYVRTRPRTTSASSHNVKPESVLDRTVSLISWNSPRREKNKLKNAEARKSTKANVSQLSSGANEYKSKKFMKQRFRDSVFHADGRDECVSGNISQPAEASKSSKGSLTNTNSCKEKNDLKKWWKSWKFTRAHQHPHHVNKHAPGNLVNPTKTQYGLSVSSELLRKTICTSPPSSKHVHVDRTLSPRTRLAITETVIEECKDNRKVITVPDETIQENSQCENYHNSMLIKNTKQRRMHEENAAIVTQVQNEPNSVIELPDKHRKSNAGRYDEEHSRRSADETKRSHSRQLLSTNSVDAHSERRETTVTLSGMRFNLTAIIKTDHKKGNKHSKSKKSSGGRGFQLTRTGGKRSDTAILANSLPKGNECTQIDSAIQPKVNCSDLETCQRVEFTFAELPDALDKNSTTSLHRATDINANLSQTSNHLIGLTNSHISDRKDCFGEKGTRPSSPSTQPSLSSLTDFSPMPITPKPTYMDDLTLVMQKLHDLMMTVE
eukprot:CFRG4248T1